MAKYRAALLAAGLVSSLSAAIFAQAIKPVDISGAKQADVGGAAIVPAQVGAPAAAAPGNPAAAVAAPAAVGPAAPAAVAATPVAGAPAAAAAGVAASEPGAIQEGTAIPLTGIKVGYKNISPQQPSLDELLNTEIHLGVLEGEGGAGYVAVRPGIPTVVTKLRDLGQAGGPQRIYNSGIAAIYAQIVRFFNMKSVIGVFVVVDSADIDANNKDVRPPERTTLQFVVVTSTVKEVRTVATGENVNEANRVDDPRHAFIREHSPLKAAPEGSDAPGDLLLKDPLDEYVMRLNRQPGRHVDTALSGTGDPKNPGGVTLDYLVSENRPWYVYAQISNTGTKETNEWRERFGFVDNQLTGHDDVLSLDYLTAGFSQSHAIVASYELPFFGFDRVRYKAYASWNEFTASDVGQSQENFNGEQWTVGDEYIWNFFQKRELFLDLVVGNKYTGITTNNLTSRIDGRANYYEPYAGVRLERNTDLSVTSGSVLLVGYVTDDKQEAIDALGRSDTTRNPELLQFTFNQSFFLEPFLAPDSFVSGSSTLAHEIYVGAHGQWAFNHRLIPQAEDVAGGLYSVRGYPESIVAGDSVIVATAEYRFHLPRALAIQSDPSRTPFLGYKDFRFSPQQPYGRPDWDLILRTFVDVGQVNNSRTETFEHNATLVGTGVGVEFQFKQNFNVRVDWGAALTDIPDEVKAGSNRFHITSTVLW